MFFSPTLLSRSTINKHTENMEMTREHITFTFDPRDLLFVGASVACSILERISGFEPLSENFPKVHSPCTNGRFGHIYFQKFLSYAKNRHQERLQTSKIVRVCPDSKGMSYIPVSFREIISCQYMYINCIS